MAYKKKKTEEKGFWQHIPGYNWLLGYKEGKTQPPKSGGLRERTIDRNIKDGTGLNK